ncbi:unnamed protein product [Ascophyllum nodosum]
MSSRIARTPSPELVLPDVCAPSGRSSVGSRTMGSFGKPPPGASDPPTFLGGNNKRLPSQQSMSHQSQDTARGRPRDTGVEECKGFEPPNVSPGLARGKETKAQRTQKFTDRRGGGGTTSPSREDRGTPSAEDVERRKHLDEAEVKVGTVESMCPEGERRRRIDHNDLDILETEHRGLYMSHHRDGAPKHLIKADDLVKRHMRAAAGTDISKPELLRTPLWLARTVDHLVLHCMDKGPQGGGDPAFAWQDPRIQSFMAQRDEPLQVVEDEASRDVATLAARTTGRPNPSHETKFSAIHFRLGQVADGTLRVLHAGLQRCRRPCIRGMHCGARAHGKVNHDDATLHRAHYSPVASDAALVSERSYQYMSV